MKSDRQAKRRAEIEEAALQLLEERGYAQTSIQAIAKRAKASNETLYNWYGDKVQLFRCLVERNTQGLMGLVESSAGSDLAALQQLERLGPALLTLLTGPRAVALNRAAAADDSGSLGAALAAAGRDSVMPVLARIFEQAVREGALRAGPPREAVETYIALLVGDWQIRRVAGHVPPPDQAECEACAARALRQLQSLLPPDTK